MKRLWLYLHFIFLEVTGGYNSLPSPSFPGPHPHQGLLMMLHNVLPWIFFPKIGPMLPGSNRAEAFSGFPLVLLSFFTARWNFCWKISPWILFHLLVQSHPTTCWNSQPWANPKPRASCVSLTCIQGPRTRSILCCIAGSLAGTWLGNGAAGRQTAVCRYPLQISEEWTDQLKLYASLSIK